ncbi:hypothetical protein TGRUB_428690 [Toxoplasma gondii RUB]|uniref:Uncharacterized protein n=1 Tax=Toxoplasma gondii RUB TaxID=935652 RepID=A0A086MB65_TOXGO|nr:hypothetical protein TGRUB_428690 [Toxoplasma gondii RUB]
MKSEDANRNADAFDVRVQTSASRKDAGSRCTHTVSGSDGNIQLFQMKCKSSLSIATRKNVCQTARDAMRKKEFSTLRTTEKKKNHETGMVSGTQNHVNPKASGVPLRSL